jgi:hypothetical protein
MRDLKYVVSEELERTRQHNERQEKRYRVWAALKAKVAPAGRVSRRFREHFFAVHELDYAA